MRQIIKTHSQVQLKIILQLILTTKSLNLLPPVNKNNQKILPTLKTVILPLLKLTTRATFIKISPPLMPIIKIKQTQRSRPKMFANKKTNRSLQIGTTNF